MIFLLLPQYVCYPSPLDNPQLWATFQWHWNAFYKQGTRKKDAIDCKPSWSTKQVKGDIECGIKGRTKWHRFIDYYIVIYIYANLCKPESFCWSSTQVVCPSLLLYDSVQVALRCQSSKGESVNGGAFSCKMNENLHNWLLQLQCLDDLVFRAIF